MTTARPRRFATRSLPLFSLALAACSHGSGAPPVYTGGATTQAAPEKSELPYAEGERVGRASRSGGDAVAAPPRGQWSADEASPPPSAGGGGYGWQAPRTEAATPPSNYRAPVEEPQPSRPGLGTVWGETRNSRVRDVEFERRGERPFALSSLYYNDRGGVEAMASYDVRRAARLDAPVAMRGGLTVSIVDEGGAPLEALSLGGRVYVVGEVGGRYTMVVTNHTARRYEVVASVDGLDVVDGLPASLGKRGYVVDPWATITIDGFRRNHEQVAAFRFGSVAASYAARSTGDRNVGVIGLAFFDERGTTPWSEDEIERRRTAEPFSDARFAQPPM